MKNNAWIAAILNFLLPGVGYLYLRLWKVGSLFLVAYLLITWGVADKLFSVEASTSYPFVIAVIGDVILSIAFAVDAYDRAKK